MERDPKINCYRKLISFSCVGHVQAALLPVKVYSIIATINSLYVLTLSNSRPTIADCLL